MASPNMKNDAGSVLWHHLPMTDGTPYSAEEVGARVRRLRLAMGYAHQAAFADAIGAGRSEVASWESGTRRPSIAKALPMVQRFKITLDWLFLGEVRHLSHEMAIRLSAPTLEDE